MSQSILDGLNPQQHVAVTSWQGPLLILAGAGSGKTRVLTHRIAYMISQKNVNPWNVLAVTFTNKAAREMSARVEKLLSQKSKEILLGTFHSCCVRILRRECHQLGFERDFIIYDSDDQQKLIKNILESHDINEKITTPRYVQSAISRAKNNLVGPDEYLRFVSEPTFIDEKIANVFRDYQRQLKANGAMDFDDLIGITIQLFRQFPAVLERYQERFRYILVDEYQDTNHTQYVLIKLLAEKYRNLCCVGDDDQSIYGWRGADIHNILNFEKDFPETTIVRLEQNYRSTANILKAASAVVRNNTMRKGKELWTDNTAGNQITVTETFNERTEADNIVTQIRSMMQFQRGLSLNDFAILYRTNAQSRVLEEAFRWSRIAYSIVGGLRFYERKEIKDAIAYLRIISNPIDALSLLRIINVPRRGIGNTTIERLQAYAESHACTLFEAMHHADELDALTSGLKRKVGEFVQLIERYQQKKGTTPLDSLAKDLLEESGYMAALKIEYGPERDERLSNIQELLQALKNHQEEADEPSLENFLADVALVSDVDQWDDKSEAITLMTLHSAKGLEFKYVFISGVEDGLLPHFSSQDSLAQLEEERRLFYVGITRAQQELYLSYAQNRSRYGSESVATLPSRFLREIPEDILNDVSTNKKRAKRVSAQSIPESSAVKVNLASIMPASKPAPVVTENTAFKVGDLVTHSSWGSGKIISSEGNGDNQKVTVRFSDRSEKKLMIKFANLVKT